MKTFKKITSIMLVLTMLFALACTAVAADESTAATPLKPAGASGANSNDGAIIIDNALVGETYSVYQIFTLESFSDPDVINPADGNYSYKVAADWEGFFVGDDAIGAEWVIVSDDGFVTWKPDMDSASEMQNFAAAALAWAKENKINYTDSKDAESTTVVFTGLNLGYYLVTSSVGTICSLDTTNPTVKIQEKNPESEITKTVENESYNIGDTINFTLSADITKIEVPNGEADVDGYVKNVVINDTMTDSFTFTQADLDALTVTITRNEEIIELTLGDNYTAGLNVADNGPGFTITFNDGTVKYGDTVTVSYSAVLNENAVLGEDGNLNKAELTYGGNQKSETEEKVYTGEIIINKYDSEDESNKLDGAEFVLKNEAGAYYKATYAEGVTDEEKATATPSKVEWVADIESATHFTTDANGSASFKGLAAGIYQLVETKAPDGYNKLSAPVTVTIYKTDETNNDAGETVHTAYTTIADVANSTGTELPSTGGMGTKLFIAIGSIMLIGAGILLVTKRRMSIIGD